MIKLFGSNIKDKKKEAKNKLTSFNFRPLQGPALRACGLTALQGFGHPNLKDENEGKNWNTLKPLKSCIDKKAQLRSSIL